MKIRILRFEIAGNLGFMGSECFREQIKLRRKGVIFYINFEDRID